MNKKEPEIGDIVIFKCPGCDGFNIDFVEVPYNDVKDSEIRKMMEVQERSTAFLALCLDCGLRMDEEVEEE